MANVRVLIMEMDDSEAALGTGVPKTTVGLVVGGGGRASVVVVVVSIALGLGVVLEAVLASPSALGFGFEIESESFVDTFDSEDEVEPMYGHVTVSAAVLLSIPRHAFTLVSSTSNIDSTQQEYTSHCCFSPSSHLKEGA